MKKNMTDIFATRLRQLRKASSLTQKALAKKLNISRSSLGNYETGRRFPDVSILIIIADYFKVSMDYFYARDNSYILYSGLQPNSTEVMKNISTNGCVDLSGISPISEILLTDFNQTLSVFVENTHSAK